MIKYILGIAVLATLFCGSNAFAVTVTSTAGAAPTNGSIFSSASPIVFSFTGLTPSQGASGTLRIIARGDLDGGTATDEKLSPSADGNTLPDIFSGGASIDPDSPGTLFSDAPFDAAPYNATPWAAGTNTAGDADAFQVDQDDWIGDVTLPISGTLLQTITADGTVNLNFSYLNSAADEVNIFHDSDFILATLSYDADLVIVTVPEPSTLFLALLASFSLGFWRSRRR